MFCPSIRILHNSINPNIQYIYPTYQNFFKYSHFVQFNCTVIASINLNLIESQPAYTVHQNNGRVVFVFSFSFNATKTHRYRLLSGVSSTNILLALRQLSTHSEQTIRAVLSTKQPFDLDDAKTDAVGIIGENRIYILKLLDIIQMARRIAREERSRS